MAEDFKIEQIDNKEDNLDYPIYMSKLELEEDVQKRLVKEATTEQKLVADKRRNEGWDMVWDMLDAYYNGEDHLLPFEDGMFETHSQGVEMKCDAVAWYIEQAFFESEPIASISPLPGFATSLDADDTCTKKEDFIDWKLKLLPVEHPYALCFHSATLKGLGLMSWYHEIDTNLVTTEEVYEPIVVDMKKDEIMEGSEWEDKFKKGLVVIDKELKKIIDLSEAKRFKDNNWRRMVNMGEKAQYEAMTKQLRQGKKVTVKIVKREIQYNDPMPEYVDNKDFYIATDTKGYHGMKYKNTWQRKKYTYQELKDKEDEGEFFNIDKLVINPDDETKFVEDYEIKEFDVMMAVRYVRLKETDKETTRVIIWYPEEKEELMIGSILYPYSGISCFYVPHYINKKLKGFYEHGLGIRLIDLNIIDDSITNMALEAAWRDNTFTPIVHETSSIRNQIANKEWYHGVPLIVKTGEKIDSLTNHTRAPDIMALLALKQDRSRAMDDASGVSSLKTGRESISDPHAPASKTLALLEESGVNIKKYIKRMLPGFNISLDILLQMYYQINSSASLKYKPRVSEVVGKNVFNELTRDELISRTRVESQAYTFDFEKANFNKTMLAAYQLASTNPIFQKNPKNVYTMLRMILKSWHPMIRERIDQIFPDPAEFDKQVNATIAQGLQTYMKQLLQTNPEGVPPQIDTEGLVNAIGVALKDLGTFPSKDEVKAREDAQEEVTSG